MADRKIIITIPRKKKPKPSGGGSLRRGPIRTERKSEYLSRRKTASGLINFYDLGQMSDGSGGWNDTPFTPLLPYTNPTDPTEGLDALTVTNWNALSDVILAIPSAQWTTRFRKLGYEDAERYGLDLYDLDEEKSYPVGRNGSRIDLNTSAAITDTTWTEEGLSMPDTANWQTASFGAFLPMAKDADAFGVAAFKITASPEYDADAATFDMKLTAGTDVFLMPAILSHAGTGDDSGSNAEYFQAGYRTLSREFWLDRDDPATDYPLMSFSDVTGDNLTDLIDHLQPDADLWLSTDGGTTYSQQPDASAYPNYSGALNVQAGGVSIVPGTFLGAIRRSGSMYYIWSTDTWSVTADRSISVTV